MTDAYWAVVMVIISGLFVAAELAGWIGGGARGTLSYRIWLRASRHRRLAAVVIAVLAVLAYAHLALGWPGGW